MPLVHFARNVPADPAGPAAEVDEAFLNVPGQSGLLYLTKPPTGTGDDWYSDVLEDGPAEVVAPKDGRQGSRVVPLSRAQGRRPATFEAPRYVELDTALAEGYLTAAMKLVAWVFAGTVVIIPILYLLVTSLLFRDTLELPEEITSLHVHGSLHAGIRFAGHPLSQLRTLDWAQCAELCEVPR
jgi:hypothetical protein